MYELRTALSYVIPRRGQLSISVVGLIAVLVIQAITWLILVFFSTTEGIESRWSQKMISVLGPMRVVPTQAYFESPYHQLAFFSGLHQFSPVRLSAQQSTLPYDPSSDPPLPPSLSEWYRSHGSSTSPVATITADLSHLSLPWRFFESTVCHMSIADSEPSASSGLSQYTCLFGVDRMNPSALKAVAELSTPEAERLVHLLRHPTPKTLPILKNLATAIQQFEIVIAEGASILPQQWSQGTRLTASFSFTDEIPAITFQRAGGETVTIPLHSAPPFSIVSLRLSRPPVALPDTTAFPFIPSLGYPVLLPKQMRQHGARIFTTGTFQFSGMNVGNDQTLTIPFFIAGFFDSGILPIGGKLAVTSRQAVMAIQPGFSSDGPIAPSGIIVDLPPSMSLAAVQKTIQDKLDDRFPGLFVAQRYDQYEVTSELFQQLASEHTLFHLLSLIIICVACSNIFSMLFILAHDRRKEIAVLRALGASAASIASIFLLAGLGVGLFGSVLGAALASLTLHYLPELLSLIGAIQGHDLLQQGIYGDIGSQSLSSSTLLFTFITISVTSSLAGVLAAVRACRMNVSEALRS